MGYNTVAIILNDALEIGARDFQIGKKIRDAAQGYSIRHYDKYITQISANAGNCGSSYAEVISQAHADVYQVVVVNGNMGWPIDKTDFDKYLGIQAFDKMKECLERNGYTVTKKRKI